MKQIAVLGTICSVLLFTSCHSSDPFKDAVASWSFSNVNNTTIANNNLKVHGNVPFVKLKGDEATASKQRGGDGMATKFNGNWIDAGQGVNEELNLTGKNVSILVRMQAEQVDGYAPLVCKAGNDQNVAYSIVLNKVEDNVFIEAIIGSDEIGGAHKLKYELPKEDYTKWHDIVFRFNGQTSELYVDGILRDDEITVGEIRDWNRRPVLIGAQYKQPYGYTNVADSSEVEATFQGLIDHVVLWNRYLSDNEVKKFSGVTELKDGKPEYYTEKYRPQFHFSAKKNWLNDPNGLVYYDGVYHLFFQYMPPHRPGAYKDWGHAVSGDLVHWEQTPNHITPHKVWSGCWSGSAVVDAHNVAGFQNGKEKAIVAFITNGGNPDAGLGPKCTQCIAYSTDGGKTFTYYDQNPVIRNIYNANRDPKVVWDEASKQWIMSLYMDKGNEFALFGSSNLKEWKQLTTLNLDGVAECPGFEPLPLDGDKDNMKWLFFGANGNYTVGSFDGTNFHPETKVQRGDYGMNYYAAQTWNNVPEGKCIIIAWMPTQRYPDMPFEQQMNFPTELTLRKTTDGIKAFRMPVQQIQNLYDKEYKWSNESIKVGTNLLQNLNGELYDMDLEINVNTASSFDIRLRNVTLHYDAIKKELSCGGDAVRNGIIPESWLSINKSDINNSNNLGKAPLAPINGKIKLRILLDRTTVEVFGNEGEIVITSCFMPDEKNLSYALTSKGEVKVVKAEVHSLKSAWIK